MGLVLIVLTNIAQAELYLDACTVGTSIAHASSMMQRLQWQCTHTDFNIGDVDECISCGSAVWKAKAKKVVNQPLDRVSAEEEYLYDQ